MGIGSVLLLSSAIGLAVGYVARCIYDAPFDARLKKDHETLKRHQEESRKRRAAIVELLRQDQEISRQCSALMRDIKQTTVKHIERRSK
jgi:hypothetical protein